MFEMKRFFMVVSNVKSATGERYYLGSDFNSHTLDPKEALISCDAAFWENLGELEYLPEDRQMALNGQRRLL